MQAADVSTLIRATIFVRDLDRATHFYRTLGLSDVYYEGVLLNLVETDPAQQERTRPEVEYAGEG